MSENNLRRRAEELESMHQGNTLEEKLFEMKNRYENRIKDMQTEQDELTNNIAKEMDTVVVQANDEINRLRSTVAMLENKVLQGRKYSDDADKWIDASTTLATLFTGVLNKWFIMINLKCMLWELLQGICQSSSREQINTYRHKFRRVIIAVLFTVKINRMLDKRKEFIANDNQFESPERGIQLFNRLMTVAAHYNPLSNKLLSELSHSDTTASLQAFLGKRYTDLHASPSFVVDCGRAMVDGRLIEAGRLIEDSAKIIEMKDRQIEFMRSGGFKVCDCQIS